MKLRTTTAQEAAQLLGIQRYQLPLYRENGQWVEVHPAQAPWLFGVTFDHEPVDWHVREVNDERPQ